MKLDNKGFAITAVLYGLLIMFVILVSSYLLILSAKKNRLDNLIEDAEKIYNGKRTVSGDNSGGNGSGNNDTPGDDNNEGDSGGEITPTVNSYLVTVKYELRSRSYNVGTSSVNEGSDSKIFTIDPGTATLLDKGVYASGFSCTNGQTGNITERNNGTYTVYDFKVSDVTNNTICTIYLIGAIQTPGGGDVSA